MLLCVPDGPNVITVAAGIFAVGTAFSGILYFVVDFVFSTVTVVVNVLRDKVQGK